jgi:hypothetical protein
MLVGRRRKELTSLAALPEEDVYQNPGYLSRCEGVSRQERERRCKAFSS